MISKLAPVNLRATTGFFVLKLGFIFFCLEKDKAPVYSKIIKALLQYIQDFSAICFHISKSNL